MVAERVGSIDRPIDRLLECDTTEALCECLGSMSTRSMSRDRLLLVYNTIDSRVGLHKCYPDHIDSKLLQRLLRACKAEPGGGDKSMTDWAIMAKLAVHQRDLQLLKCIAEREPGQAVVKTEAIRALRNRFAALPAADPGATVEETEFVLGVLGLPSACPEVDSERNELLKALADGFHDAVERGGQNPSVANTAVYLINKLHIDVSSFLHAYLSRPVSSLDELEFLKEVTTGLGARQSLFYGALLDRLGADMRTHETRDSVGALRSVVAILGELRPIDRLGADSADLSDIVAMIDLLVSDDQYAPRCWSDAEGHQIGLIEAILSHTDLMLESMLALYSRVDTMQDFLRLESIRERVYPSVHPFIPVLAAVAEGLDVSKPESLELAITIHARYSAGDVSSTARSVLVRALTSDVGLSDELIAAACSKMADHIDAAVLVRYSARAADAYLRLLTQQGRLRRRNEVIELLLSNGCDADRLIICTRYLSEGSGAAAPAFWHTLIILSSSVCQLEPDRMTEIQEALLELPGFSQYVTGNVPLYIERICDSDGVGRLLQGMIALLDSPARLALVARAVAYARHQSRPLPTISWAVEHIMGVEIDQEAMSILNESDGELAEAVLVACFDYLRQSLINRPDLVSRAVTIMSGLDDDTQRSKWLLEFARTVVGHIRGLSELHLSSSAGAVFKER